MIQDIVFIRHGRTQASIDNQFLGHIDSPLIDFSLTQFDNIMPFMEKINPSVLIHSTMKRAVQSANIISGKYHFDQIIQSDLLIERALGKVEGLCKSDYNRRKIEICNEAEPKAMVADRLLSFLRQYKSYDRLAVISHSNIYRVLISLPCVINISMLQRLSCGEAAILQIKYI